MSASVLRRERVKEKSQFFMGLSQPVISSEPLCAAKPRNHCAANQSYELIHLGISRFVTQMEKRIDTQIRSLSSVPSFDSHCQREFRIDSQNRRLSSQVGHFSTFPVSMYHKYRSSSARLSRVFTAIFLSMFSIPRYFPMVSVFGFSIKLCLASMFMM